VNARVREPDTTGTSGTTSWRTIWPDDPSKAGALRSCLIQGIARSRQFGGGTPRPRSKSSTRASTGATRTRQWRLFSALWRAPRRGPGLPPLLDARGESVRSSPRLFEEDRLWGTRSHSCWVRLLLTPAKPAPITPHPYDNPAGRCRVTSALRLQPFRAERRASPSTDRRAIGFRPRPWCFLARRREIGDHGIAVGTTAFSRSRSGEPRERMRAGSTNQADLPGIRSVRMRASGIELG
jgi:hypothetical protein